MSTPGGAPERVPSTVKIDKTTGAGKAPPDEPEAEATPAASGADADAKPAVKAGAKPAAKSPAKPATKGPAKSTGGKPGARPTPKGGGGGKGRKPVKAVKVNGGRNWGPIAVVAVVVLVAGGIIGYAAWGATQGSKPFEKRAADIKGIVNYRTSPDKTIASRQHKTGVLSYSTNPPVGGDHNPRWQNCTGDVYDAPIAKEHAVHSLEHGAVWVTYRLGIPADQVATLAKKVTGKEYMLMSPIDGLDHTVSLQAWGYQLKVDSVDDKRIDQFISVMRVQAAVEPGASCSGGVTATGTTPQDSQATG